MQRLDFLRSVAIASTIGFVSPEAQAAGAKAGPECLAVLEKHRKGMLPFELPVLGSSDQTMKSSEIPGKAVWLNFFASWCGDCTVEMPSLIAIEAKYRDSGLTVIGIDVDETEQRGSGFRTQFKIPYPILTDSGGRVFSILGTGHLPTHLFYNADRDLTCLGLEGFTEKDMDNEVSVALGL
jgi:thiol-disulfide isomerase/thioredoxin